MSGQRVGVFGETGLEAAIEAAGGEPVDGEATDVAFVVAAGDRAVSDIAAEAGPEAAPVLPVGETKGIRAVPQDRLEQAVADALAGTARTERHPVVTAAAGKETTTAVFDVALMAAEPAQISEFSVRTQETTVSQFRADGLVVSTPAGSTGYGRRAGGPTVAAETGVVSVVPVAPFSTASGQWVLPIESVTLTVERDETPVELLADGRREWTVGAATPLSFVVEGQFELLVVDDSRSRF